ncbi:MAG: DUF1570 domain-containing protein [Phycisphaerales bacterium]|jgi:hypothetical protein|nr:DUF1570 domain-containing protein [Phycisphaerales bacterium]MDP6890494.1 DUF1570 domain-containing protein [Phycisphaerales bacterium]
MWITLTLIASTLAVDLPTHTSGQKSVDLARQLLPDATPHRTARYVVLSDGDRQLIRSVEHSLEEARRQYDRWCRVMRVPRPRPDERLLCILFHEHEHFVAFAQQTERLGETAKHVSGYFSPRFDWIVCFDPWDSADLAAASRSLDEADIDIEDAEDHGADPDQIAEARQRVNAARQQVQQEELARRSAVTIHEAVHQLVHVGDAFPGRANWPAWIHEGIAVAFETDNHRKPFGPDRGYAPRVEGFCHALREQTHLPLGELLAKDTIDHANGSHVGVLYDQAGSLISWLHMHKRRELAVFLNELGILDPAGAIPNLTEVFTRTIGPPAKIEQRWHADVLR